MRLSQDVLQRRDAWRTATGDDSTPDIAPSITLTLPYPVSANRYWRSFFRPGHARAIVTLSDAAIAYRTEVVSRAISSGLRQPIAGLVRVRMTLSPKRPKDWEARALKDPAWQESVKCMDIDNAVKVTVDALKGIAYVDDAQIWSLHIERAMPVDGGALVIEVGEMAKSHEK
jgi:crossover junction endodeoxyribonuclease RusA